MKASDYTLPFYLKCLSQHIWDWRSRFVTTHVAAHHERNEEMLKQVAHERGDEFLTAFNQHTTQPIFPFAGVPAAETKPNQTPNISTPMKIEINIPDELFNPLVQAIDRLTAVMTQGKPIIPRYDGPLTGTNDSAATLTVEATPEPEKPKAGRPKKEKTEPAPAVAAETTQVVNQAEEITPTEAPPKIPTGPELSEKVKPLAAHPELQQDLIRFKANDLKINGPIRLVTDEEALAKFDAKVIELLAKIPAEV
jgi:hypothetical protein